MARYIDAEILKHKVLRISTHFLNSWDTLGVLSVIDETPTEDVDVARHGSWVLDDDVSSYRYSCSCCGELVPKSRYGDDYFSVYCPGCGARMDLVDLGEK